MAIERRNRSMGGRRRLSRGFGLAEPAHVLTILLAHHEAMVAGFSSRRRRRGRLRRTQVPSPRRSIACSLPAPTRATR
jgi:hypothetical protein